MWLVPLRRRAGEAQQLRRWAGIRIWPGLRGLHFARSVPLVAPSFRPRSRCSLVEAAVATADRQHDDVRRILAIANKVEQAVPDASQLDFVAIEEPLSEFRARHFRCRQVVLQGTLEVHFDRAIQVCPVLQCLRRESEFVRHQGRRG